MNLATFQKLSEAYRGFPAVKLLHEQLTEIPAIIDPHTASLFVRLDEGAYCLPLNADMDPRLRCNVTHGPAIATDRAYAQAMEIEIEEEIAQLKLQQAEIDLIFPTTEPTSQNPTGPIVARLVTCGNCDYVWAVAVPANGIVQCTNCHVHLRIEPEKKPKGANP